MVKRFLLILLAGVGAQAAPLEIRPVFTAGTEGYHTYRIPALIVTTRGTLLAFCEGRKDGRSDAGKIDLLLKRSKDSGQTWSAPEVIWTDQTNTCGNPAPVIDRETGTIGLLMTWNDGADREAAITRRQARNTRRVFVARSRDDGLTWSKPEDITASAKNPDWDWYATGPGNGIQLERGPHRGRLVIPANHSQLNSSNESLTRSHVIFSDDHGATWQLGGSEEEKTNESALVELSDGSLLHNMRSYHGKNRRATATSRDGGITWSAVKLDAALIEPVCQASIFRYSWPGPAAKNRILFANPASVKRENVTVRLSYDDAASWPVGKVLFAGPSAYSSLAVLPDQSVVCLFECGEKNAYETISLAHFPLTWLEEVSAPEK